MEYYFKDKANLLFKFHANGVSLFQKNCVSPQIITQRSELMVFPFTPSGGGHYKLFLVPVAFCIEKRVHWKKRMPLWIQAGSKLRHCLILLYKSKIYLLPKRSHYINYTRTKSKKLRWWFRNIMQDEDRKRKIYNY